MPTMYSINMVYQICVQEKKYSFFLSSSSFFFFTEKFPHSFDDFRVFMFLINDKHSNDTQCVFIRA